MESILTSIKKLLGIAEEYTHFDEDLIIHINSVFAALTQIGVGPSTGFTIDSKFATWDEFISDNACLIPVKSYVHLRVRLLFDPPSSSAVMSSMERQVSEFEWRLRLAAENLSDIAEEKH